MAFKYEIIEPKLFAGAVADEIAASVADVLAEKERCSLVLAGGSTPVPVYRALSVSPRVETIEWSRLDLFFGDERWVPHSHTQSNLRMVNENLTSRLRADKPHLYPLDTELDSPEKAASEYEAVIRNYSGKQDCQLDIVLLGMGDDGHTASIFPGSPLISMPLADQTLISVENWPDQPGSYRVTMTPRLLMAAQKIIFIVQGAAKAEMLQMVFDDGRSSHLPVNIFRAVSRKVSWFLDSEAARLIKN